MKVLAYLYKNLRDCVKDAEMNVDYAEDLEDCPELAEIMKYFAANAMNRLTKEYKDTKTLLDALLAKEKTSEIHCIAEVALEELDEWKDNILRCIEKM